MNEEVKALKEQCLELMERITGIENRLTEGMIKKDTTDKGWDVRVFADLYGARCSIQKSSLATKDAIWFGVHEDMNGKDITKARMHLDVEMVKQLLPILQHFVETGELP